MLYIFKTGDKDFPYLVEELENQDEAIGMAKRILQENELPEVTFFPAKEDYPITVTK